jgi:seryl-tRNA synthetase
LRALLRHYVEEIDRLNKENEALRTENTEIKSENQKLNSQVAETSRRNEVLSERMTLAEKLNVTGVRLTALNKKGKTEKKIEKAVQLMVTFTIPQNNSTPVGEKTIYMRLISPSGQLLGSGGSFKFEGGSVACSAKKVVEYAGEEIGGINIYWDVNTALTSGDYTVELFADNYRLASKTFNMN